MGLVALWHVESSQIGIESVFSALAGKFLTTGPQGKSWPFFYKTISNNRFTKYTYRYMHSIPGSSAGICLQCRRPWFNSWSGRSPGEGIGYPLQYPWTSLMVQMVKNPPAMQATWVQPLGSEDPLEEGMTTLSSILAWRIPMNRGTWRTTAHGVTKSRTRLSDLTQHRTAHINTVSEVYMHISIVIKSYIWYLIIYRHVYNSYIIIFFYINICDYVRMEKVVTAYTSVVKADCNPST